MMVITSPVNQLDPPMAGFAPVNMVVKDDSSTIWFPFNTETVMGQPITTSESIPRVLAYRNARVITPSVRGANGRFVKWGA